MRQIQRCCEIMLDFFHHLFLYSRFPTIRKTKTSISVINKYANTLPQIIIILLLGYFCRLWVTKVCELAATAELAGLWADRSDTCVISCA